MLESVSSPGAYGVIVSDFVEIILFGIYTILYVFALMILTMYKRPLPIDWLTVTTMTALYTACMGHCSIITTDRYTTFTSGWPIPTGTDMSGLLRVGGIVLPVCAFTSQLTMIHRCWAMWDYKLSVVLLPVIMSVSGFACALVEPTRLSTSQFVSPWVAPRMLPLDIAFCILSLLVYIMATVLITVHLRRVSTPVRNVQSMESLIWSLVGVCIETGALLMIAQFAVVILLVLDHPGLLIAESIAAQIYGIAPTIMIIRLGLKLLPHGHRRFPSTSPQFSTLFTTIDSEESDDIEINDTPVEVKPPPLTTTC